MSRHKQRCCADTELTLVDPRLCGAVRRMKKGLIAHHGGVALRGGGCGASVPCVMHCYLPARLFGLCLGCLARWLDRLSFQFRTKEEPHWPHMCAGHGSIERVGAHAQRGRQAGGKWSTAAVPYPLLGQQE